MTPAPAPITMNVQKGDRMAMVRFQEAPGNLEAIKAEKDFQSLVVDALRTMGYVVIHVREMFGNTKGIPDLLIFRGERGYMVELKILGNYLSAGQRRWQERWLPAGTEVLLIHNTQQDWEYLMERVT